MSTISKITGAEFDSMVERGAFDGLSPRKIELIRGEIRFMNPAGPVHDDYIDYLIRWSTDRTAKAEVTVRVQCGFVCDENRPEPDLLWLAPKRYGRTRPSADDVLLLIEVSDSSIRSDLYEKADLYAESRIAEYWVIDVRSARIHVMSDSDGMHYRKIEVVVSPNLLAPRCRPTAFLDLADLFSVTEE